MSKRVAYSLSPKALTKAIRELKAYKSQVESKCDEVARRVTEHGRDEAEKGFMIAQYDGPRQIEVSTDKLDNTHRVIAKGHAVAFIEFGAGVHYNGSSSNYPLPKPEGIVGIGEYGYKQGRNDSWTFRDGETGDFVTTHGNPAQMPMYHASVQMRQHIEEAAREVFGDV